MTDKTTFDEKQENTEIVWENHNQETEYLHKVTLAHVR